jgi:hypothetical protein
MGRPLMQEHPRLAYFLSTRPELKKELAEAIALYSKHPNSAVRATRACVELLLDEVARANSAPIRGRREELNSFIDRLTDAGYVPFRQAELLHWVREIANAIVHARRQASKKEAILLIAAIESLTIWFCNEEPKAESENGSRVPAAKEARRALRPPSLDAKAVPVFASLISKAAEDVGGLKRSEVHKSPADADSPRKKGEVRKSNRTPKTLSLKKVEISTVKQSFTHGRTKAVVVEKKRLPSIR